MAAVTLGRMRGDALFREAVIAGEDHADGAVQRGPQCAPDQSDLRRERFQPAQRADRLGLAGDEVLKLRLHRPVEWRDIEHGGP